ncbi:exodeoxyribonuclease I subunit D [Hydrogenivirga caldilitoris]|uniref:Nuclease SbcCD subunit D n=1 Tax=Hydrogenivirga caldilitoris TaxID=246264 RepID=A0A497XR37_9AQUI|nr:exonuclease subunit SbcD [Hydrogenivirga caldilitoris]RLJ71477.1 exodeoxyribonuclease I subunit D [Hydrogenivirga caldilitoris]
MKLLHIADLHAGKTLGKVSRNPDLEYALSQVVEYAKEDGTEVLLVAGDVFDKANPDNESKELIFDFFLRLKNIGTEVVVIAGNHDSYDFMKSIKGLTKLANVHIYDRPSKEHFLYSVGELKVACLPYPSERVITGADEDSKKSYAELVGKFIRFLAESVKDARFKVLLAHLFIAGSTYTKTEREATITHHYAVQPASLSDIFDYVALGHVHKHQRIEKAPTYAYYTGSLYQLDFSEAGDKKFFNRILFEDVQPRIEVVELSLKNPLSVFNIEQSKIMGELDKMKATPGYLKIVIKVEDKTKMPPLIEKLREELGEKLIKIEQIEDSDKGKPGSPHPGTLDPLKLYREYYQSAYGKELPEEIEKKFLELLREAEGSI